MAGLHDLPTLLRTLQPVLAPGRYVFLTIQDPQVIAALDPVGTFREAEGITAICPIERAAAAGLPLEGCYRQLMLQVHSSLQAVGFLAAVSTALARAGIPCNAFSAYHHDHLFIPEAQAAAALEVLQALAVQSG